MNVVKSDLEKCVPRLRLEESEKIVLNSKSRESPEWAIEPKEKNIYYVKT